MERNSSTPLPGRSATGSDPENIARLREAVVEGGGLDEAERTHPGKVKVFQAGTRLENGLPVANGGRILGGDLLGLHRYVDY